MSPDFLKATTSPKGTPNKGEASGSRALNEPRVDPGCFAAPRINPPSKLSADIPRGKDNTKPPAKMAVKR